MRMLFLISLFVFKAECDYRHAVASSDDDSSSISSGHRRESFSNFENANSLSSPILLTSREDFDPNDSNYLLSPSLSVNVNFNEDGYFDFNFEGNFEGNFEDNFEGNFEDNFEGNFEDNFEDNNDFSRSDEITTVEKTVSIDGISFPATSLFVLKFVWQKRSFDLLFQCFDALNNSTSNNDVAEDLRDFLVSVWTEIGSSHDETLLFRILEYFEDRCIEAENWDICVEARAPVSVKSFFSRTLDSAIESSDLTIVKGLLESRLYELNSRSELLDDKLSNVVQGDDEENDLFWLEEGDAFLLTITRKAIAISEGITLYLLQIFEVFNRIGWIDDYQVDEFHGDSKRRYLGILLSQAVNRGSYVIASALLNLGAPANNVLLLLSCVNLGSYPLLNLLLEKGFNDDAIAVNDNYLEMALVESVRIGNYAMISRLLEANANIHYQEDYAFIVAVHSIGRINDFTFDQQCRINIVKLLIKHGANIHAQSDKAMRYALSLRNLELIDLLFKSSSFPSMANLVSECFGIDNGDNDVYSDLITDRFIQRPSSRRNRLHPYQRVLNRMIGERVRGFNRCFR